MSKTKTIKPLYKASELKKTTKTAKLWVAFKSGSTPTKGSVYGATLTRDQVRCDYAKRTGCTIQEVRSRRASNLAVRKLKNAK